MLPPRVVDGQPLPPTKRDSVGPLSIAPHHMFKRLLHAAPAVLLLALTNTAAPQQRPTFKTPQDISAFLQAYYVRPQPELIPRVVDALRSTGFLEKTTAVPPLVGFLSEVFAANPDRLPQWSALIAEQDEGTKAVLERALSVSKAGGVVTIDGHSAELNDVYWGAFFASGNPDLLKKLIDQLRYCDERDDFYLFMAGATAKWSLASNAQSQALVHSTLEGARPNADKRTQELITELLTQGPARVKQETSEIIRKRRQAGKWR